MEGWVKAASACVVRRSGQHVATAISTKAAFARGLLKQAQHCEPGRSKFVYPYILLMLSYFFRCQMQ